VERQEGRTRKRKVEDSHKIRCEGDLVSTMAMFWVLKFLGKATWMANPSRLDLDANTLLLAHCTIPKSLTTSYKLRSHFESGMGVAIDGEVEMKTATLLRLGGNGMEKIWICEADVVPDQVHPHSLPLFFRLFFSAVSSAS
jgi:hypothetical protein